MADLEPTGKGAADPECAHDFSPLPDGTKYCRSCGLSMTGLGTPLPQMSKTCAECGSDLPEQALVCAICGTATPWAMRQKIIIEEQRYVVGKPTEVPHNVRGAASATGEVLGTTSDVLGTVFSILNGW